jgi:anti-anti-sigma factor
MATTSYEHLESRIEQGVLILTITDRELTGEDLCAALRQELLDAVTESGARRIVVDFQHVKYVASVAFRPLLSLRRQVHDTGARMALCNLSRVVAEVFYATGVLINSRSAARLFEEEIDVAAAIASLNRGPG